MASTIHPKWAKVLADNLYEINLLDRIDFTKLDDTYKSYDTFLKDNPYFVETVKNMLGRTSLRVTQNDWVASETLEKLSNPAVLKVTIDNMQFIEALK